MTKVKICGLTEPAQALAAARAGADYIGVVLAPSRRRVTPEKAVQIVSAAREARPEIEVVGVFVNEEAALVNRVAGQIGLTRVQFSGDEDYDYCQRIERPLIKVLHVRPGETAADVAARVADGARAMAGRDVIWLLDTGGTGAYGGSGRRFDRRAATQAIRKVSVIVAGGLTPDNVAALVREVRPFGVDVSSGVETEGAKDMAKIESFIQAVRQADAT